MTPEQSTAPKQKPLPDSESAPSSSTLKSSAEAEQEKLQLPKTPESRLWREGGRNEAIAMVYRDEQGDTYDKELFSKIQRAGGSVVFLVSENEDLSAWKDNPAVGAQVHFIKTSSPELFVRDYFPLLREDAATGEFTLIDAAYGPHLNKIGDGVPQEIAKALDIPLTELKLNIEFGNVVNLGVNANGQSQVAVSDRVLSANSKLSEEEIKNRINEALGVDSTIILKQLPSSATGHVDEFLQELDKKLILARIPNEFIPLAQNVELTREASEVLEHNAKLLSDAGYEVLRVNMPPPSSTTNHYPGYIVLGENGEMYEEPTTVSTHDYNTFANWLEVRNPAGERKIIIENNEPTEANEKFAEAYRKAQAELGSFMKENFNTSVEWHSSQNSLRSMQAGIHCITASLPLQLLLRREKEGNQ